MMVKLHVTQEPVSVSCKCENCGAEIVVTYHSYTVIMARNDGKFPSLHCLKCGHENEVEALMYN